MGDAKISKKNQLLRHLDNDDRLLVIWMELPASP